MAKGDFSWAMPVMRAGYAGRALVYVVLAGFSLWAIWQGGQAEGTKSALARLEQTPGGKIVLGLICLGMASYAVWRLCDSLWDLEEYGTDAKGIVARVGMIVTGLVHLSIGFAALTLLLTSGGQEEGSRIPKAIDAVLAWPGGRWLVGLVGLTVIGSGAYYLHKAWKRKYREKLKANHFTRNWDWVLRAGVAAQGVVVGIIGFGILYAAITANPEQAGGVGDAFSWLSGQVYGQVLVTLVCVGLLGFALFCAVNAAYRIISKVDDEGTLTLATSLKAKARQAAS